MLFSFYIKNYFHFSNCKICNTRATSTDKLLNDMIVIDLLAINLLKVIDVFFLSYIKTRFCFINYKKYKIK